MGHGWEGCTEDKEKVGQHRAQVGEASNIVQLLAVLGEGNAGDDELHNVAEGSVYKAADDVTAAQRQVLGHVSQDERKRDDANEVLQAGGQRVTWLRC